MKTLSIILADELYDRLKTSVAPRKISKFVSDAVEMKLTEQTHQLYKEYLFASQDKDRENLSKDWDVVNIESWT